MDWMLKLKREMRKN